MELVERESLEEIDGVAYRIKIVESDDHGSAALTHLAHNYGKKEAKTYKKGALQYVKDFLTQEYPEDRITKKVAEQALQSNLS